MWNAEYLGKAIKQELVEHYLSSTCFLFAGMWSFMPRFRNTDQWKLGWVPRDFVTNVQIALECTLYLMTDEKRKALEESMKAAQSVIGTDVDEYAYWDHVSYPSSELLKAMKDLFNFKQGTKINIGLYDGSNSEEFELKSRVFRTMAPIISRTLQRLVEAGYGVKVVLESGGPHPESPLPFNIVMTTDHHDWGKFEDEFNRVSQSTAHHRQVDCL